MERLKVRGVVAEEKEEEEGFWRVLEWECQERGLSEAERGRLK